MQYRTGCDGEKLSALGFGCMRLTRKGTGYDRKKAEREIMSAIGCGVNYFDTAWAYAGNEALLGRILEANHVRDRIYLATKLPHYLIRTGAGIENTFREELKRLRTDHIDYYLIHMLNDTAAWEKLKKKGIEEWIAQKKASGEIRHIGFSYHGSSAEFRNVVDAYDWDFCQIQYNYMDEYSQAGRAGLQYAHEKGLPVIIMEPLRGGRLTGLLPAEAKRCVAKSGRSAAEWGLRWLFDQPEVTVVLSGMNSLDMIAENVRIASESEPDCMTERDRKFIGILRRAIDRNVKVRCTGCGYCMPCPQHVDIPGTFRCYNEAFSEGKGRARRDYLQTTAMRGVTSSASQCVKCGKCEKSCPQHLPIRRHLAESARILETPFYRGAKAVVHLGKFY